MWIPVDRESPRGYTSVLIHPGEFRSVTVGFIAERGRWFDMEGDEDVSMPVAPTHWMALPDPPK